MWQLFKQEMIISYEVLLLMVQATWFNDTLEKVGIGKALCNFMVEKE